MEVKLPRRCTRRANTLNHNSNWFSQEQCRRVKTKRIRWDGSERNSVLGARDFKTPDFDITVVADGGGDVPNQLL